MGQLLLSFHQKGLEIILHCQELFYSRFSVFINSSSVAVSFFVAYICMVPFSLLCYFYFRCRCFRLPSSFHNRVEQDTEVLWCGRA